MSDAAEASPGPIAAVWQEATREPLLLVLAAGTIAAGLALRRPQLTRDGARMLASQIVLAAGAVATRRLSEGGEDQGRSSGWVTEAVVGRATQAALAALNGPRTGQGQLPDQAGPSALVTLR